MVGISSHRYKIIVRIYKTDINKEFIMSLAGKEDSKSEVDLDSVEI